MFPPAEGFETPFSLQQENGCAGNGTIPHSPGRDTLKAVTEEINNVLAGLERLTPRSRDILLSSVSRNVRQSTLQNFDGSAVDQTLGETVIHKDIHVYGAREQAALTSY